MKKELNQELEGIEDMAYIAAHPEARKQSVKKAVVKKEKPLVTETKQEQELEGIEDMAYTAAHPEARRQPVKKSIGEKVMDYIKGLKRKKRAAKRTHQPAKTEAPAQDLDIGLEEMAYIAAHSSGKEELAKRSLSEKILNHIKDARHKRAAKNKQEDRCR